MTTPPPPCEIDVLDPRFYDDPWDAYAWLREHSPVHWDTNNEMWVLSRHADVSAISRNQERYSAADGGAAARGGADVDHLDGRSGAHPPASAHQPRLHPGQGAGAHRPHPG